MPKITINENCIACRLCLEECVTGVFIGDGNKVRVNHAQDCIGCGHCVALCPQDAINHEQHPLALCPTVDSLKSISPDDLETFLRSRRSTRLYQDRPIPAETLERLANIGRFAPTGSNKEDVELIIITDRKVIDQLEDSTMDYYKKLAKQLANPLVRFVFSLLVGKKTIAELVARKEIFERIVVKAQQGKKPILYGPPALFIFLVDRDDYFSRDNACYTNIHIIQLAETLGLSTCINGMITVAANRSKAINRILKIPSYKRIETAISIGYPRQTFKRLVNRKAAQISWV